MKETISSLIKKCIMTEAKDSRQITNEVAAMRPGTEMTTVSCQISHLIDKNEVLKIGEGRKGIKYIVSKKRFGYGRVNELDQLIRISGVNNGN